MPSPSAVLAQLGRDGWAFYGPNVLSTPGEAARGLAWGNGLVIALEAKINGLQNALPARSMLMRRTTKSTVS